MPRIGSDLLLKQIPWNLGLILLGSLLCTVAINGILVPHHFLSGGFVGIVLALHYLFPSAGVSSLYLLLNIPLFILGWIYVGRRFFFYSLAGMFLFSGTLLWTPSPLPVQEPILAALLAGILGGVGSGIILKSLGSAGGLDILSVILNKRISVRLGTTVLAFNGVVLLLASLFFSLESALYTLIYIYVTSQLINLVVSGLSQRKVMIIVSEKWEEIRRVILGKGTSG